MQDSENNFSIEFINRGRVMQQIISVSNEIADFEQTNESKGGDS